MIVIDRVDDVENLLTSYPQSIKVNVVDEKFGDRSVVEDYELRVGVDDIESWFSDHANDIVIEMWITENGIELLLKGE